MEPIYHITTKAEITAASPSGEFKPTAFDTDGFIHCSFARQVEAKANELFRGQRDLVVLVIDRSKLSCDVVVEDLKGEGELYPHVYGVLPLAAVSAVVDLPCDADGRFMIDLKGDACSS